MNTNTARNNPGGPRPSPRRVRARATLTLLAFGLACLAITYAPAATVLGPWVPMFKGIEYAVGTNTAAGGGFPNLSVVYFLRVDLTEPTIQLYTSPRVTNYLGGTRETAGYTTTNFVKNHNLQVAINANSFSLPGQSGSPSYSIPEGSAFHAGGVLFSQGVEVSVQDTVQDSAAILFTSNNVPTFFPTNWPAAATAGVYTAVSGLYSVLVNGVNIGSNYNVNVDPHGVEPRTAFGLSQNRQYLFLLAIDGRQDGYSEGAYDWETAAWLLLAGAWDGVNMDGGGSTCMAISDTTGTPVPLNRDSASAAQGRERTVGVHFGIYAAPVPGFFANVRGLANDTSATVSWDTTNAATTQLKYGTNLDMTSLSVSNSALLTNHAVLLTNLTPNTAYYFAALASIGSTNYVSSNYLFTTANYVTPVAVLELASTWKYTTQNLNSVSWKARTYDDSGWPGSGPGLLWADAGGADPAIPAPMNTEMPLNPNDLPFTTYYFRAHFNFTNNSSGVALQIEAYVDDGAVFYLNGTEIYRVRMPAAPTVITNGTFATALPCSGDATCTDTISLSGPIITTNLLAGDNVLAVEVHNRSTGSGDVTFGLNAWLTVPYTFRPTLNIAKTDSAVALQWTPGGYVLQSADAPTGSWADVLGPVISSPFTTNNPAGNGFFRLRK